MVEIKLGHARRVVAGAGFNTVETRSLLVRLRWAACRDDYLGSLAALLLLITGWNREMVYVAGPARFGRPVLCRDEW